MTNAERGKLKREEIYFFIIDYIKEHGYAPTIREIGEAVNLKSTSSVHTHMSKLFIEGVLESDVDASMLDDRGGSASRAYRVAGYKFVKG
jgi:repressor LexA